MICVFEVVDEFEIPESNPSYSASSLQSIRFKFTAENTAIQIRLVDSGLQSQWGGPCPVPPIKRVRQR